MNFTSDDTDTCNAIFEKLLSMNGVVTTSRMRDTQDTYMHSMERVDFVVVIIILAAAALAMVVLFNLSNINITERQRELATIKLLGFYDKEVSAYVYRENIVLTVCGILMGCFMGHWLHIYLVRSTEIDLMMFGRQTAPSAYVYAAILTMLFSVLVNVLAHNKMKKLDIVEIKTTVENEKDKLKAVEELKANECHAAVVFLGNFGPDPPETLHAKNFDGPCMFVAAAEGDGDMINGRGDAYCGMLNCSYNLGMRLQKGYIPDNPNGTADELADKIAEFIPIARAIIGVKTLKLITFGPRPQDFFASSAPIKGLYELGVEIEENSELDLLVSYKEHAGDARIPAVCEDMAKEMGEG